MGRGSGQGGHFWRPLCTVGAILGTVCSGCGAVGILETPVPDF